MIRSKQTRTSAVAVRSFTGKEGRLRPGQRFETTVARLDELRRAGLARAVNEKAVAAPSNKMVSPPKNKAAFSVSPAPASSDQGDQGDQSPPAPAPAKSPKKGKRKRG
jgi:hypothetical protein